MAQTYGKILGMLMPLLALLTIFAISLLAVAWLNQRIYAQTNLLAYYLTGSAQRAYTLYFLLMLPGIFVHEASHWIVAKLLGLKPGKFRIWPQAKGKRLRLGSVTARSGGIWLDSLVGIAPLLIGSLLIALIGERVFSAEQMMTSIMHGNFTTSLRALVASVRSTDGPLWGYLLFTLANGMMPSAPDREPIKPVLAYLAIAILLYLLLGMPLDPFNELFISMVSPLQSISSALLLTILIDVLLLVIVGVVSGFVASGHGR